MGFKWFTNETIDYEAAITCIEDELEVIDLASAEMGMPYRFAIVRYAR